MYAPTRSSSSGALGAAESRLAAGDVPEKILELSSYHAIVACVASGTGIAIVPRAVLETVRMDDSIAVYAMPEAQAHLKTYLVWRKDEASPALRALQADILESNAGEVFNTPTAQEAEAKPGSEYASLELAQDV